MHPLGAKSVAYFSALPDYMKPSSKNRGVLQEGHSAGGDAASVDECDAAPGGRGACV